MRALQTAKTADAIGQVVIIPLGAAAAALLDGYPVRNALLDPSTLFFSGLFGVGGWQIASCILSACFLPREWYTHGRRVYEKLLILVLAAGGVLLWLNRNSSTNDMEEAGVSFAFLMLFLGPLMAIFYFTITVVEHQRMRAKRAAHNSSSVI